MNLHLLLVLLWSLLCFCLLSQSRETLPEPSAAQYPAYVEFLKDYSTTYDCRCVTSFSEYDIRCEIVQKSSNLSATATDDDRFSCSDLPTRVIAQLNISCSNCPTCATVNLHEMTQAHVDEKREIIIYPPSEIYLDECNINNIHIRIQQLIAENVTITESMEVAQFGVPQYPGVGGYYTVNVTYPTDFNESDCWLIYLHMNKTNMWFLPAYILQKCQHIRSVIIEGSPITWVSMTDLLALRSVDSLTLRDCNVKTFADDSIAKALTALDEYLQHVGPQLGGQNPLVAEAIKMLHQMRQESGRLNLITNLYDMMDSANISFSLLFGYRSVGQGSHYYASDIPYGAALSYVNLAFNKLTEIPYALSMFGNLARIDLSHNQIRSLYRSWICWYPPIPDSEKTNSSRHCYWFRGSRQTLKVLDLSYNRIDQIGEIQPWHGVALAELYLQNNYIININPDAFSYSLLSTSLLTLYLDGNPLPYIQLQSLSRLEVLSIVSCSLKNVEPISIPKSNRLRVINLTMNIISSIAANAFDDLPSLDVIDLRQNSMKHLFADSFLMSERPTLSSRVVLLISGQKVETICDCDHVYAQILREETGLERTNYLYPMIPDYELSVTSCQFFKMVNGSSVTQNRLLNGTTYTTFLCVFSGENHQKIPDKFCEYDPFASASTNALSSKKKNLRNLTNSTFECWETCVPHCTCFHTAMWELSDLNCNSIDVNMVRIFLRIPVKYMYLSGIKGSDFFRRISDSTLRWQTDKLSSALVVLYLNDSNVHYIEEKAFVEKPSIMLLYLDDNKLESVQANAFCTPNSKLRLLTLTRNKLSWLDPDILSRSCLPNLTEVRISENPWSCQCSDKWLSLHSSLISVSRTTQVVADFQSMLCQVDQEIIEACNTNGNSKAWKQECKNILESNGSRDYLVSDEGRLISVCNLIEKRAVEKQKQVVMMALTSVFGLVLLGLAILAVRRRHRLLAVVRVLVLLKYQRDRRHLQQVSRDSMPYDAMLWASDRDQDCLVDVLNCVRSASGGDELELCVPESFLYSDLCSCPLTYFDCPAEGAKFSGKVVVALSERFLDTQYLALCQVIRELDSVGRNPFKDIVFLRLSSHKVSLQRQRQLGPEDVEAFKTLQRILAGGDIVYKSVDWEYRLIERIRSRDSAVVLVSAAPETMQSACSSDCPARTEPEELADLPGEDQPLVVDLQSPADLMGSRLMSTIRDWPPFHSDKVSEVFILSASEFHGEQESTSKTVVERIVRRLPGVRLGTNDAALAASWPDNFEAATPADRINSFLMKRTRQFVVLLSNGLLSWLRNEAGLQCEFQAFLAANSFRRRLLVVLVGQVDSRSRARYQALANQRLDGGESGPATNWFDITADGGDVEALGNWLDCALYKSPG